MELEFHQMELRYRGLRAANPKEDAKLLASLAHHGQLSAVLVVRAKDEGRYVLIDGYRRVEALRRLGKDTVEAQLAQMSEAEALMHAYRLGQGTARTALEEGWLLSELCEGHGLSQVDVAVKLQRSSSWVSRRLALVSELPDWVQELVRLGKICPYAAGKYLVPLARAKRSDCERLVDGIKAEGLSVRQIEVLYEAWRDSAAQERERIVVKPVLFLKAWQEVSRLKTSAPRGLAAAALLSRIEALGSFCRALRNALKQAASFDLRIRKAWEETLADIEALSVTAREVFDAGCGYSNGDSATCA